MTITITLNPEIERGLLSRAKACGVPLEEFAREILMREAGLAEVPSCDSTGQSLIDACARMRGLLTDEEVDRLFRRNLLPGRSVELE